MISLLTGLLFVVCALFAFVIYHHRKRVLERNKDAVFLNNKKASPEALLLYYQFFNQWFLTRRYISKIRKRFEILIPGESKEIAERTMKVVAVIWVLTLLSLIILVISRPTLYTTIIMLLIVFVLNNQVLNVLVDKEEIKILKQFERFLGDVRHQYHIHGMADEAIYDALEFADYEIGLHGSKIHEILSSKEMEEEVSKYYDNVPNRFLKTFLALCVTVMQFGDKQVEGRSLFLSNIKNLKQEIYIELLKRQKINYLFSGLIFITLMPVFFLKLIENWGVSNLPELELYYQGAYGIIVSIIILLVTVIAYMLINRLKESYVAEVKEHYFLGKIAMIPIVNVILTNYLNQHYGRTLDLQDLLKKVGESLSVKQFYVKRVLFGMAAFFGCLVISITIHSRSRFQHIYYVKNIANMSSSASKVQIADIEETIVRYVGEYKNDEINQEKTYQMITEEGVIRNEQLIKIAADEIVRRQIKYQKEYFKWYELIIACLASVSAYWLPYFIVLYSRRIMQMSMEDEVIQFQSIILMLMHIDRMSIENILEWLENFSVIFRPSIQECINDFSSGDIEALDELIRKEPFEPFVRLIENLQMCDKIGIEKAFDEVAVERANYQEKRKQENDIYINNKAIIGKVCAYAPLLLTLAFYLIIPFIGESLTQLLSYINQVQGM